MWITCNSLMILIPYETDIVNYYTLGIKVSIENTGKREKSSFLLD